MENNFKLVNLNVGGMKFSTYYDTLKRSTYFQELVQNKKGSQAVVIGKDNDPTFFIDRDGQVFQDIMHYLRSCDIGKKTKVQLRKLKNEAAFFKFDELVMKADMAIRDYYQYEEQDQVCYRLEQIDVGAQYIDYTTQSVILRENSTIVGKIQYESAISNAVHAIYKTNKNK